MTSLETKLLRNIAENEFAPLNGGVPETFQECGEVWADCLNCGPEEIPAHSLPGIMASLVKKRLAGTNGEIAWLTQTGFNVYRAEIDGEGEALS